MYELKLDGYRAIAFRRHGDVSLRSRNDNDFNVRYPSGSVFDPDQITGIETSVVGRGKEIVHEISGEPKFLAPDIERVSGLAPDVIQRTVWIVTQSRGQRGAK